MEPCTKHPRLVSGGGRVICDCIRRVHRALATRIRPYTNHLIVGLESFTVCLRSVHEPYTVACHAYTMACGAYTAGNTLFSLRLQLVHDCARVASESSSIRLRFACAAVQLAYEGTRSARDAFAIRIRVITVRVGGLYQSRTSHIGLSAARVRFEGVRMRCGCSSYTIVYGPLQKSGSSRSQFVCACVQFACERLRLAYDAFANRIRVSTSRVAIAYQPYTSRVGLNAARVRVSTVRIRCGCSS